MVWLVVWLVVWLAINHGLVLNGLNFGGDFCFL